MDRDYNITIKETSFIAVSLFFLILTPNFPFLFSGTILAGKGEPTTHMVLSTIYLLSMFWATRNLVVFQRALLRTWLLWFLVALAAISTNWAPLPDLTLRHSIALILTTTYATYIATRISLTQMLYLQAKIFAFAIAVNLLVIFLLPEYGIHQEKHFGAWRGFFSHKNLFGQMLLFAGLTYFTLAIQSTKNRKFYWTFFFVTVLILLKSRSQTSLIVLFLACCCTPLLKAINWSGFISKAFYIFGIIGAFFVSYLITAKLEPIMAFFGRDTTFTSRTNIWRDGITLIEQRPWLGFGYGSQWISKEWGLVANWSPKISETIHLHNGYLELTAQLGLIGLGLYAIIYFFLFIRAIILVDRNSTATTFWPLFFLIALFFYNFPEPLILQRNSFIWVLFIMLFVWLTGPLSKSRE